MNKKIMVVDDDPDILMTIRTVLEKDGYEVTSASCGKECLELLENNGKPNIILLDIMMPDINGWNVFASIREKPGCKKIPIVFITAKTDRYSLGFGKTTADDYITKPFEIHELKEKIDKILER